MIVCTNNHTGVVATTLNSDPIGSAVESLLQAGCTLCEEAKGNTELWSAVLSEPHSRMIIDSPGSVTAAALGQIVEGYLVVFPKKHVLSWALLPDDDFSNFAYDVKRAEDLVAETYGGYVLFEHGMDRQHQIPGCGICHAHVHIVPTDATLSEAIRALNCVQLSGYADLKQFAESGYLMIKNAYGLFGASPQRVESQYLRLMLAKELGFENRWNWKQYVGRQQLQQTITKYRRTLCDIEAKPLRSVLDRTVWQASDKTPINSRIVV